MADTENPTTEEDWLVCLTLPKWAQVITSGHFLILGQAETWTDGNGDMFTREEYMAAHDGADPAIIWAAVKKYRAEHGGVVIG